MCCGIVPILFSWFLSVPSLHALVFLWKTFLDLYVLFFLGIVFRNGKREERWGKEKMHTL